MMNYAQQFVMYRKFAIEDIDIQFLIYIYF